MPQNNRKTNTVTQRFGAFFHHQKQALLGEVLYVCCSKWPFLNFQSHHIMQNPVPNPCKKKKKNGEKKKKILRSYSTFQLKKTQAMNHLIHHRMPSPQRQNTAAVYYPTRTLWWVLLFSQNSKENWADKIQPPEMHKFILPTFITSTRGTIGTTSSRCLQPPNANNAFRSS